MFEGERPWLRPESDFRRPGTKLEEYVLAHRPELVCAILTMARGWILAGRPRGSQPTLGSFESWSRFVPDLLEWSSSPDGKGPTVNPIARMSEAEEEDEDGRALGQVLFALSRLDSDGAGLKARDIVERLYPTDRDGPPDGFDDARDAIETVVRKRVGRTPDPAGLAYWLRGRRNQRRGDLRLVGRLNAAKTLLWTAERVRKAP
jgi:hypothetical protein